MFKLLPAPIFRASVPLSVAGVAEPIAVAFQFRHKGHDALQAWIASAPGRQDMDLLNEVIEGWDGVYGLAGEPVEYSIATLADLIENHPPSRKEIFAAYVRELSEAKKKT